MWRRRGTLYQGAGLLLAIWKLFFQKRFGLVSVCPKDTQRVQCQSKCHNTPSSGYVFSVMEGMLWQVVWHVGGQYERVRAAYALKCIFPHHYSSLTSLECHVAGRIGTIMPSLMEEASPWDDKVTVMAHKVLTKYLARLWGEPSVPTLPVGCFL